GEDVQRKHRQPVDQEHRQLEDDEVLGEQRHDQEQQQHHEGGAGADRHGPLRNGFDCLMAFRDDFFCSAHDQTRLTICRPNRPAGLTTRTEMISASAIGSFSSLPTPGMYVPARFSKTPTRKPPTTAPNGLVSPPSTAAAKP